LTVRWAILAIEIYLVITALDLLLAWVQPEPTSWPRRFTHLLTEPLQAGIRVLMRRVPTGGWDLSPLVVVFLLGLIRVILVRA
jgi:uncharacterized protein YggT (Ycf19 family)